MPIDPKKPAPAQPVKEQNPIAWLLGFKESDDQRNARETREAAEKRTKDNITQAVKGFGTLKKVVKDSK